jgi:hypothetical protein
VLITPYRDYKTVIIKVRDVLVSVTSHLVKVTRINNRNEGLMSMDKDKNKPFKPDPAITILVLTAFGYGITYVYETGYKSYYKLPAMFIDLSINSMTPTLSLIFIIFAFIYAIWIWLKLMYSLFSEDIPLRFFKFTNSTFFKLGRNNIKMLSVIWTFFFMTVFFNFTDNFGESAASNQTDYMVIKQEEKLFVAVTSYKDSLIIAPLDLEKEAITPTFKAIEMKDLKDAETIHFKNGLKVEDVKNSKDLIE